MRTYLDGWRRARDFRGRSTRLAFWTFIIVHASLVTLLAIIVGLLTESRSAGIVCAILLTLLGVLPAAAITVRRLHDSGRSGLWTLIALVPTLGQYILFVLLILGSQPGSNEWGDSPT